jgi:hypothetical protein
MFHDRLAAHPSQVIHFLYIPAFGLSIVPSPLLVVLWAFPLGLVLGGDTNPDADRFVLWLLWSVSLHAEKVITLLTNARKNFRLVLAARILLGYETPRDF